MKDAMFQSTSTDASSSVLIDVAEDEILEMVGWMRDALGVNGLMVTVDEMKRWTEKWESAFKPATTLAVPTTTTSFE